MLVSYTLPIMIADLPLLIAVADASLDVCSPSHPTLLWLSLLGDIVTTVGFYAVAVALTLLAGKRESLRSDWRIHTAVAVLIVAGSTHLLEVWSMWSGAFTAGGWIALLTIVASIATVYIAWQLVAKLAALPSRRTLEEERERRILSDQEASRSRALFEESVARHASEISEAMLKVSRLASIVDSSQDAIIGIEASGEIWEWNPSAERLFGFTEREVLGRSADTLFGSDGSPPVDWLVQALSLPTVCTQVEVQCRRKDGAEVPVWLFVSPIPDRSDGKPGVSIIARDMSEKKITQERLTQSLADKELLLKEVHHRVKNNLQIICSLLRLQSGYVPEGSARVMFRNSEERVKCMALVHERLYRSESLSRISFDGYVAELTKQLVRSHVSDPRKVRLELDLDTVSVSIDKAVPSGLILNELIANAIQYGSGEDGVLTLVVALRKRSNTVGDMVGDTVELLVSDRGPGIPATVDLANPTSLGLRVVNTLCKQLSGRLVVERDGGTAFRLEFPCEQPEATREHTVGSSEAVA